MHCGADSFVVRMVSDSEEEMVVYDHWACDSSEVVQIRQVKQDNGV